MAGQVIVETRKLTKVYRDFWGRQKKVALNALNLEIWSEGARNGCIGPALAETFSALRTAFAAVIRRGQAEGEFDPNVDAETMAAALMSAHPGYRLQRALQLAPAARAYATAVKTLLRGLRPREA